MKHALFDESLVAGAPNARRESLGAVMVEQIGVGLVQDSANGLTEAGLDALLVDES